MTPERWQLVDELFHSVLEREPAERAAFLAEACAGDEVLRREVEKLITAHEEDGSFIDSPAYANPDLLIDDQTVLNVGQRLGHYKVISHIGSGGMGEVFLAEDIRLGRKVALKLLRTEFTRNEERLRRFQQEARAASSLNHPNILTIHEIGQGASLLYMATEYVQGQTLRQCISSGRMTLGQSLEVAIQVASALAAAHQAGIIHRDIKPENVMLRTDGYVKVLDFGLAKLAEPKAIDSVAATLPKVETTPGLVMGTVSYMSPEQARGLAVDARTDIWSLAVIIYEMVTGHQAFEGETASDVMSLILQKEPLPLTHSLPEVPGELERLVRKALRKDKEERYQTVKDLLIDLRNLRRELELEAEMERSAPPATSRALGSGQSAAATAHTRSSAEYIFTEIKHHKRGTAIFILATLIIGTAIFASYHFLNSKKTVNSLAVLPFVNATADPNTEYLSDGITESLINNLSRLPRMKIMSRSSVVSYKGKETDVQTISRELGVEAVLMGRITQRGDELSISVELVDARDNSHIWGEQYNRRLSDILAVQEAISREVSEKLRVQLTGEEQKRLSKAATENPEAYQLYLKGRYHLSKRTDEGLKKAIEYFNQTIEKDPAYALAYSGLADSNMYIMRLGFLHGLSPRDSYLRAKSSATRALEIDDNLAQAHTSLAVVKMEYEWEWATSEREFKRALELNPNEAEAHHQYSHYLTVMGRTHESLVESLRALEIDPLSLPLNAHLAWHYVYARQYDQAIEQCRKTIEMDPNFPQAHDFLAGAYEQKGMHQEAIAEFQKGISLSGDSLHIRAELGHAYAVAGKKEEALKIMDELKRLSKETYISPYDVAMIYVGLGQKDQAFDWLEKAYQERSDWLRYLKVDPRLDPLRSDLRFPDLVRRVGLPQ
ncbi:MAG: protein kinase [Pyrinomonadaceae bacterium]